MALFIALPQHNLFSLIILFLVFVKIGAKAIFLQIYYFDFGRTAVELTSLIIHYQFISSCLHFDPINRNILCPPLPARHRTDELWPAFKILNY